MIFTLVVIFDIMYIVRTILGQKEQTLNIRTGGRQQQSMVFLMRILRSYILCSRYVVLGSQEIKMSPNCRIFSFSPFRQAASLTSCIELFLSTLRLQMSMCSTIRYPIEAFSPPLSFSLSLSHSRSLSLSLGEIYGRKEAERIQN